MSASRPNLVVDGKLDHAATTAELRRCIDTLLRKGRFELAYEGAHHRTGRGSGARKSGNPCRVPRPAIKTFCSSATPNCSRRSSTLRSVGCGSIPNSMAASVSIRVAIAIRIEELKLSAALPPTASAKPVHHFDSMLWPP